jgi:sugar O-acyltransferase (sialic acid O-acetyltransferase NeuD family)
MKNLVIIGARGFGREVYWLAKACIKDQSQMASRELTVKGFLDDHSEALQGMPNYPPILGSVEHYVPESNDVFVCALGSVVARRKYTEMILKKGGEFISLIHPTAKISENAKVGTGCILLGEVGLSCEVVLGDFNVLQYGCLFGHDVRVGNFCHFNARVFLGGGVFVGDGVTVNVNAIIHPRKKIGDHATIGAGCFVIRNVKPESTVFGNPAKVL